MEVVDHGHAAQVEEVLALALIAGAVALPVADMGQGVLHLHPLTQGGAPWGVAWRSRSSVSRRSSGWMFTLRPRALSVQAARRGQAAQTAAGKCTVPPGAKGIWCPPGQRNRPCSQSRWKAALL